MYSWEIDNYLREKDYKLSFQEVRDIMQQSPQIINWKMESMNSDIPGYGRYSWKTSDSYNWTYYIKNKMDGEY